MLTGNFKNSVLPLSKKLLRFAHQMLQNQEEAKDVLQDIFLKLWQKRDQLAKIDNLEAFTMRMIRNRCLDVMKSKQVLKGGGRDAVFCVSENDKYYIPGDAKYWVSAAVETDHFEMSESAGLVKRIISTLPELQRTVIHLRDIEQMEYDEIAGVTGLTINAVRVNLSRARQKVREEIIRIQNYGITENKHIASKVL